MRVYFIGAGPGDVSEITFRAAEAIRDSEILIGARRMAAIAEKYGKPFIKACRDNEILGLLKKSEYHTAGILLSGDSGFYSGAKRLLDGLEDLEAEVIPGISSVSYFCAKLRRSWDDVFIVSLHGRKRNIIGYIKRERRVFALLSGGEDVREICRKLVYYGMGGVRLNIGRRLSYPDEEIISAAAEDMTDFSAEGLMVLTAENDDSTGGEIHMPDDGEFIRGKTPMTKAEVRTLVMEKLRLKRDSVLYDVGAGTGSVSVCAALKSPDIRVYAIEKDAEAAELIEKNKRKFAADNIELIRGTAPEALSTLEPPTHVFIGGSSGNMRKIIDAARLKNPEARIVINAASLNTITEITEIISRTGEEPDITEVNISRAKRLGRYYMMNAGNPVYIAVLKESGCG